jgi:hypothetical protein
VPFVLPTYARPRIHYLPGRVGLRTLLPSSTRFLFFFLLLTTRTRPLLTLVRLRSHLPPPPPNRSSARSQPRNPEPGSSDHPSARHHAQGRGQAPLVRPRLAPRRRWRQGPARRRPPPRRRRQPKAAIRHRDPLLHRRQRYVHPSSPSVRSGLPWMIDDR